MSRPTLPDDIVVLERGWLSSNNILLRGAPGEGAVLVDTGYATHAAQTLALVDKALAGEPLRLIVNTHLHSDHCGGNAALVTRHGCLLRIPPGDFAAAAAWDERRLSFDRTGQSCPRFHPDGTLSPGERIYRGSRRWDVHAAPGHDPASIVLFDAQARLLLSADALWERGFGIVFPEIDGHGGFDEVEATLDLIETLAPRTVIPGHGAPFSDLSASLAIARDRLAHFRRSPERHARHAAKALLMFHMLEVRRTSRTELLRWMENTPVMNDMWRRFFEPIGDLKAVSLSFSNELIAAGQLRAEISRSGEYLIEVTS